MKLGRGLVFVAALVLLLAVSTAAMLEAASMSPVPPVFLAVGWLVLSAGTAGVVWLALARRHRRTERGKRMQPLVSAVVAVSLLWGAAVLWPLHDPQIPPAPVPGMRTVMLETGSRIAYVKVEGRGAARSTPIVFLHGGPGVPDMKGDMGYFGRLAEDGFDVYLYDQIGAGHSARLDDPRQYTIERHVADLEALRRYIGAERMNLIGHSWGSSLAALYLARHSERVEKVVFSSPGEMWLGHGPGGGGIAARLSPKQRRSLYMAALHPRALVTWLVAQVNPAAAHRFTGDAAMDARFDILYARSAAALYCDPDHPREPIHGLGAYANLVPQTLEGPDTRAALSRLQVPALVIKGSCDYLPWETAVAYRETMPRATLVYLRGAGHQAYVDQTETYFAAVRAFLLDEALPVEPYRSDQVPSDFEGPHG